MNPALHAHKPFVFIADDDSDDVFLVESAIEQLGLDIQLRSFGNGRDLMVALQDEASLPSLVLLDLNMPVQDGKETLRLIRSDARFKNIPVVILSTSSHRREQEFCLRGGADNFYTKPFTFSKYVEIVEQVSDRFIGQVR